MGSAQASDYLENALIDHLFRARTFAKPPALYLALFTAAPSDAGGGTEVAGGGYTRINCPPSDANWLATQGGVSGNSSGTSGQTANTTTQTFPAPTANWGTVVAFGIFDAVTGGNLLIWDQVTTPRTVNSGDPAPTFQAGSLVITIG